MTPDKEATTKPIRVHYEDGYEHHDYLLDNGCIVTIQTPLNHISVDELCEQFGIDPDSLEPFLDPSVLPQPQQEKL